MYSSNAFYPNQMRDQEREPHENVVSTVVTSFFRIRRESGRS